MGLTKKSKVDLHIHSNASDGSWGPEEVVWKVKNEGLALFALTDHDSTENLPALREKIDGSGIAFLPGVEISSTLDGQLFHILGYGIKPGHREIEALLSRNRRMMEEKDDESIRMLIAEGFAIDFSEYRQYKHDPSRGGWKCLNFLVDKGFCNDVNDFFNRLFSGKRKVPFPIFTTPEEVIKVIEAAGGTPVLAHPAGSFIEKQGSLLQTLEQFFRLGIRGIECFHPDHSREATELCLAWCNNNKLIITGGSDCHGLLLEQRKLGQPEIFMDDLHLQELGEKIIYG